MRVAVIVRDGVMDSALAVVADVLGAATALRSTIDTAIPRIEVLLAAPDRRATTMAGHTLSIDHDLADVDDVDVTVVPALGTFSAPTIIDALDAPPGRSVVEHVRRSAGDGRHVAAACNGVFVLAEAGLLARRRATTTWHLGAQFRARYPAVRLDTTATVVTDGKVTTAGAAFAHIDLAFTIVRTVSGTLASQVAQMLLIDQRACESAYAVLDDLAFSDPLVTDFEHHVRTHLGDDLSIGSIAAALGTSRRTMERRVKSETGSTPIEIVQRLRVERSRYLRRTTEMSSEQIANAVGYSNGSTLRTLERRLAAPAGQPAD